MIPFILFHMKYTRRSHKQTAYKQSRNSNNQGRRYYSHYVHNFLQSSSLAPLTVPFSITISGPKAKCPKIFPTLQKRRRFQFPFPGQYMGMQINFRLQKYTPESHLCA